MRTRHPCACRRRSRARSRSKARRVAWKAKPSSSAIRRCSRQAKSTSSSSMRVLTFGRGRTASSMQVMKRASSSERVGAGWRSWSFEMPRWRGWRALSSWRAVAPASSTSASLTALRTACSGRTAVRSSSVLAGVVVGILRRGRRRVQRPSSAPRARAPCARRRRRRDGSGATGRTTRGGRSLPDPRRSRRAAGVRSRRAGAPRPPLSPRRSLEDAVDHVFQCQSHPRAPLPEACR
jgi:hypothetical protein